MGGVSSTNTIQSMIMSAVSIANSAVISISQAANVSNEVNIKNCNIKGGSIKQSITYNVDTQTLNSGDFSSAVAQNVQQQLDQIAEAVSQNLTLNFSATEADNYAQAMQAVKTEIVNAIETNLVSSYSGSNAVNCEDSTVTDVSFDQQISSDVLFNAVNNAVANTQAAQDLSQAISQTATAKQENAFLALIILIVAIVVIIVGTGGKVLDSVTKPAFILAITPIALVIGYFILAYTTKLWPFQRPAPPPPPVAPAST